MIIASNNLSIGLMVLSLFVLVILYYVQYFSVVSGGIDPFPRQEIKDGIQESVYSNININPQLSNKQRGINDNPMDILGVTHFSDGNSLNATLWRKGMQIKDPSQFDARELEYGILVDIDNRIGTGKFDVDFQKQIKRTADTNNWTSVLIEYSSSGLHKAVAERRNISNFEDMFFFPISLDLNSITSPSKFRVAYYTVVTFDDNSKIIDITSWIDVPPTQFSLSSSTNPLVLTKGILSI